MITIRHGKLALAITALFVFSGAFAGPMSESQYDTAKARIGSDYDTDKAACETFSGNAKDVCQDKASGKEHVARAQLEADYTGKASDANEVAVTRANAKYATAKELCDNKAGDAQNVCIAEAKATRESALAGTTVTKAVVEASEDAAEDTRDADYTAAKAQCDHLAGPAKDSCISTAKARFGKD